MQSIQEPAFSVAELAERWNVHHRTVLRAIRDNRLPAFRAGGRDWRIKWEVVQQIESGQQSQSTSQ